MKANRTHNLVDAALTGIPRTAGEVTKRLARAGITLSRYSVQAALNDLVSSSNNPHIRSFAAPCERAGFIVLGLHYVDDLADHMNRLGEEYGEHRTDDACTVDSKGECIKCGATHSEPCSDCGGRAFHTESCVAFIREIAAAVKTIEPVDEEIDAAVKQ